MFVIHSPPALAAFHTSASLIGLVVGLFVLRDLLASRRPAGLAILFLAIMAVANLSGFLFPSRHIGVGHVSGVISVAALAAAIVACAMRCAGAWASVYAVGVVTLLYCDALIAVFMVFVRVPFLHEAGPGSVLGIQLLVLGDLRRAGPAGGCVFRPDEGNDPDLVTVWPGWPTLRYVIARPRATSPPGDSFSRRPMVLLPPGPAGQPIQAAQS